MNHIAYHNAEEMGYLLKPGPPYSVLSNRTANHLVGCDVWLIEGLKCPRQYFLRQRFRVDHVEEGNFEGFRYRLSGPGFNIAQDTTLNIFPWFKAFLKSVGNFGIGLPPLQEQFLTEFNHLLGNTIYTSNHPSTKRALTSVNRIIRDTAMVRRIKQLHDYECQLYGYTIELPNGERYVEVHHIQPLGAPHNGPDIETNVICVCPNHHAQLDLAAIKIDSTLLNSSVQHRIDEKFTSYHNAMVDNAR